MHRLYSNKLRPDLPKLRNAIISGFDVDFLRYDPKDCYALLNYNCNSVQKVKVVLPPYSFREAWYFPNFKPDPKTGLMIPFPEIKIKI